jgi:hypothetical protein
MNKYTKKLSIEKNFDQLKKGVCMLDFLINLLETARKYTHSLGFLKIVYLCNSFRNPHRSFDKRFP